MAKQTKRTIRKTAVKPAPVMEHQCGNDCPCGCHKHGASHRLKHIIILLIVFILGYACGKVLHFGPRMMMGPVHPQHPVFVNGCLDMQNMQNPMFKEKMLKADTNGDGCISVEEYKAHKAAWADKHGKKHGFFNNMKHNFRGAKIAAQQNKQ